MQSILFRILLVLLFLPMLQTIFNIVTVGKLGGYKATPENATATLDAWFDASFQNKKEDYLKAHFGFRNWALRLDHQLAYSLYNASKTPAVTIGQEGYLFDRDYILEHNGKFEVKKDKIDKKLDRLRQVQDTLQKLGKHFMVVIAPNKADFFPEYLPKEDQIPREGLETNYAYYAEALNKRNINCIDANKWFIAEKGKQEYPLFPQTGIHFSFYGAAIFSDSIIKNIEKGLGKDLPDITWSEVEWDEEPRKEDDDLEEALNIVANLPSYKLPYPKIVFNEKGKYKPRSLTIGDSFYWRFVGWDGLTKVYNNGQFWFYNREAHPGNRPVKDLNFAQEINNTEVVCILMASVNLRRFGFGFDDQLYKHFFGDDVVFEGDIEAKIQAKMEEARNNPKWFSHIKRKAEEEGKPIEEVLKKEVTYVVNQELKGGN